MRPTAAVLIVLLMALEPAQAGLEVCNKADVPARVALGRFDGTAWRSSGWWVIEPRACKLLLSGPLDARYYYLYGTDGGAGTWSGDTFFCTQEGKSFDIPGRNRCAARNYDRKGFFVIDTGNEPNWKQTLSN
jgi:uncharacterized membrane protein